MKLFDIPDIRLFWSEDERFLNQFKTSTDVKFKRFSKYPPTYKDISFWITKEFTANDLFEVIRSIAGDIVEEVGSSVILIPQASTRRTECFHQSEHTHIIRRRQGRIQSKSKGGQLVIGASSLQQKYQ